MKAHQIMTRDVMAVTEDSTVESVAQMLVTRRISAVPVVADDNKLVGMVSLNDLFPRLKDMRFSGQRLAKLFDSLINLADLPDLYWTTRHYPVTDVMDRFVPQIDINDEQEQITSQLLYSDYRSLPVVEDGRLVGIISRADLLRVAMKIPGADTNA
jgi:CBS domain-containing protein